VGAASEALPFKSSTFDLVYCFSAIEHGADVEASIREMVRVTRPGGTIYVHTPNAWFPYEGHYKVAWLPLMPRWLARAYLRCRGRPVTYLAGLRRVTRRRLVRAFPGAGIRSVRRLPSDPPRVFAWYQRLFRVDAYLEMVA
jgi:ubiquinone/menaquinone biosynthesis C-methylase UbiE